MIEIIGWIFLGYCITVWVTFTLIYLTHWNKVLAELNIPTNDPDKMKCAIIGMVLGTVAMPLIIPATLINKLLGGK